MEPFSSTGYNLFADRFLNSITDVFNEELGRAL
jgi:hypothetical protein